MHFSLAELLTDLFQNAVAAESSRIDVRWHERDARLRVSVEDNGKGMGADERARAVNPFYTDGAKHPGRKVGLGLPFLIQTVSSVGGRYELTSEPGGGTKVVFEVPADHLDLPPTGDLVSTFTLALTCEGPDEVEIERVRDGSEYTIRRTELAEIFEDLATVEALQLITEYVRSQEEELWQR
ncbi:MAG: ATP-binding protein [Spirochaetales bacterium]